MAKRLPKPRPKHRVKEIEKVLREAEQRGWTFTKGKGYIQGRCPCGKHLKGVHLTPGSQYAQDLNKWFRRQECWKER